MNTSILVLRMLQDALAAYNLKQITGNEYYEIIVWCSDLLFMMESR